MIPELIVNCALPSPAAARSPPPAPAPHAGVGVAPLRSSTALRTPVCVSPARAGISLPSAKRSAASLRMAYSTEEKVNLNPLTLDPRP